MLQGALASFQKNGGDAYEEEQKKEEQEPLVHFSRPYRFWLVHLGIAYIRVYVL